MPDRTGSGVAHLISTPPESCSTPAGSEPGPATTRNRGSAPGRDRQTLVRGARARAAPEATPSPSPPTWPHPSGRSHGHADVQGQGRYAPGRRAGL